MPTFSDYYTQRGKIPTRLTLGFSYLTALYQRAKRIDGKYFAGTIELKDEPVYLERFASGYSVKEFMQDATLWGEDLTAYEGFLTTVEDTVFQINQGGQLP